MAGGRRIFKIDALAQRDRCDRGGGGGGHTIRADRRRRIMLPLGRPVTKNGPTTRRRPLVYVRRRRRRRVLRPSSPSRAFYTTSYVRGHGQQTLFILVYKLQPTLLLITGAAVTPTAALVVPPRVRFTDTGEAAVHRRRENGFFEVIPIPVLRGIRRLIGRSRFFNIFREKKKKKNFIYYAVDFG